MCSRRLEWPLARTVGLDHDIVGNREPVITGRTTDADSATFISSLPGQGSTDVGQPAAQLVIGWVD